MNLLSCILKTIAVIGMGIVIFFTFTASNYDSNNLFENSDKQFALNQDIEEENNIFIPVTLTYSSKLFSSNINSTNLKIETGYYDFAYCIVSTNNGFLTFENSAYLKSVTIKSSSNMSVSYSLSNGDTFTPFKIDEIKIEFYDSNQQLLSTKSIIVLQSSENPDTYDLS